jgi:GntR family transcriptional regulator
MPRPHGFAAAVPLYYQLAGILREHIVSGKYHPGDRLPTEEALSRDYDVSRITIRQALSDLEKEGFIKREAGRGTFVADRTPFSNTFRMEGSLEDLISMGLSTSVKVLTLSTIKASASEAEFLRVNLGDPLVRCTRLRLHAGTPFSYIINHVPGDLGKHLKPEAWKKGSILRQIETELGIPMGDADQTISASLADAHLSRLLKTNIGAALLSVDRVVRSLEGRPVEHVHSYYRSDIYSFKAHLVHNPIPSETNESWSVSSAKRRGRADTRKANARERPRYEIR